MEIDGLGVMEQYRHNAIGSSIQSHVGKLAKTNPVILVADGEDTAKDMYIKQGYTYLGFRYQILKTSNKRLVNLGKTNFLYFTSLLYVLDGYKY